ncbi:hypothetical protein [Marmoricola sp. RAF53]|uniref:hypothetical protein n=1 Tax=Marmoricola sp. RAF53 TaxID=3233059 RepID=UPI003F993773
MPTAEEFDEFYLTTRRRLVLQTFALTGDLGAARSAVRDAYVAARHHWDKAGRLDDPENWVRPRAWSAAARRHTARLWHKERHVTAEQAAVLEALHKLPDAQRRVLILNQLATMPLDDIGREVGLTREKTEEALQAATAATALALECDSTEIRARLETLDEAAGTVKLPRAPIVRRNGLRRRRNHAIVGSALIAFLTVGAGAFVAEGAPAKPAPRPAELVAKRMLLTPEQVAPLTPRQPLTPTGTTDNTQGTGLNTMCQTSSFADDNGLGTWVRKFAAAGVPAPQGLVQTVEISNSPGAARAAYDTTLGWYTGCRVARIQLVDAYDVTGVGDQAQILRMRIPSRQDRSYVVGVARTGALTTSTVLESLADKPLPADRLAQVLAASVQNLCESPVAGACVTAPQTVATLPPPSGETPGMLAIADLPAIGRVMRPWVGTDPQPATLNPAATTCDNASFTKAGATKPLTRSFLIPNAGLPKRFGLTETIGTFATPQAAARFHDRLVTRMKACPDKELGSTLSRSTISRNGVRGSSYALWRLENQVNQRQESVAYWTAVIRAGKNVAQVTMTPVDKYDVDKATFQALVNRARDRLFEVG